MAQFLYETHLHTAQASKCGVSLGRDYIQKYIDMGFSGIIVTDHFYGGNCGVDRALPWNQFVDLFCAGYEDAAEEGEKRGLQVFFGWEQGYEGDEYLVYGLDKLWLKANPDVISWTRLEQYQHVRADGGCVVQAHPFRQRSYISKVRLSAECVDAVEAYNTGNEPDWDALAERYAKLLSLPMTAGSDIHRVDQWQDDQVMGVAFDHKLGSIHDYTAAIRDGEAFKCHVPEGRGHWNNHESVVLPIELRDDHDCPLDITLDTLWIEARKLNKRIRRH